MRSLRSLGPVLAVLVLAPAAALAYLGLQGAEGYAERMRQRIREDLAAVLPAVRALAESAVEADGREAQAVAEDLAAVAARRLPFEPPARTLRALRAMAGPSRARLGSVASAYDAVLREPWVDVRVVDAAGRQLLPAIYDPEPAGRGGSDAERLWDDLRARADMEAYGRGDLPAALRIWEEAGARLAERPLRARVEVEAALLATGSAGSSAAEARAAALLGTWSAPVLEPLGRPWVLLLLRALPEGRTARERLLALEGAEVLDEVPLTLEERARLQDVTRPVFGTGPARAAGGSDVRSAPLPQGLRLELRRQWPDILSGPGEVLNSRLSTLRAQYPWLEARLPDPRPGQAWATDFGPATLQATLTVPTIGGRTVTVHLGHRDAELTEGQARTRRGWMLGGALALVGVLVLGLLVTRRAFAREREARRLKDDFLANVSHELRTPLTSVCLHADLLAEPGLAEERRRGHAEVVRAEGARLSALVDELLDFAALERGSRRLEVAPVDLSTAVARAVEPFRVLAEREGVTLRVAGAPDEVAALADPHALARILANLVGNAWKHGRPSRDGGPGRIEVEVAGGPGGPSVSVRDDGPGIPAAERARLFERFHRGAAAAKTRGVGLGLALSRDLARSMGGDLVVVEDPEATVFRLTLPPEGLPPVPPEPAA